jgi:hypothetical protein
MDNMVNWVKQRIAERTTWDGGVLVVTGITILFLSPLAKIIAGAVIVYGIWTIVTKE